MARQCWWLALVSCYTGPLVAADLAAYLPSTPNVLDSLETLVEMGIAASAAASTKEAGDLLQVLGSLQGRRLTSRPPDASCSTESLVLLAPSVFANFTDCVIDGYMQSNMSIPGMDVFVYSQCWCRHNMTEVMGSSGLNCCGSSQWQWVCNVNCSLLGSQNLEAICTEEGSRAKRCIEECSSMCLEADYPTTPGCRACAEDQCDNYIFCLEWHTAQKLQEGDVSLVCNERKFDASRQVEEYWRCAEGSATNTNWQRYNTRSHCICDANVQQAATDALCCGHGENEAVPWAAEFCEVECRSQTDCRSDEAKQCMYECDERCHVVDPRFISEDCLYHCIADDSPCHQYRTCQPKEPEAFTYFCDDGSMPESNGCCEGLLANGKVGPTCPLSCQAGRAYYLGHGVECGCYDCEESQILVDLEQRGNDTVAQALYANGVQVLGVVARQTGLRNGWPTPDMVALMNQRNYRIMDLLAVGEQAGQSSLDVQLAIHSVSTSYNHRIDELARKGGYEPVPDPDARTVEVRRRGVPLYIMIVVLSMSLGAMLILVGLRILFLSRRRAAELKRKQEQEQSGSNLLQHGYGHAMQPGLRATAGEDLTIVVGQPVCPPDGQQPPKGTAMGAPLSPLVKGGEKVPMVEFKKGASSTSLKEAWA
mmetsp:Transcript_42792/g.98083  ORF Transcript_42792/g.98083 Transcript_42792/m.98083 type:complete len:650 (+) Transcript_42792:77-2026(+)